MTNDEYLRELAQRGDGSLQAWFESEHVESADDVSDLQEENRTLKGAMLDMSDELRRIATVYED